MNYKPDGDDVREIMYYVDTLLYYLAHILFGLLIINLCVGTLALFDIVSLKTVVICGTAFLLTFIMTALVAIIQFDDV